MGGWEDDGWGAVNVNGVMPRFPNPDRDPQQILIQTREDGVSIRSSSRPRSPDGTARGREERCDDSAVDAATTVIVVAP